LDNGNWDEVTEIISGKDWFNNWADFPNIVEVNGNLLTSYLQKSDTATYAYDVKLNLYSETLRQAKADSNGSGWKKNFILHNDGTKSEHGFVSMQPYVANSFVVTWLDGRNTSGGHDTHDGHSEGGAMSLRAAIVFEDGSVQYDSLLDERVCDCCGTSTAIGPDDEIIVAYRDRSDEEIRDVSVVRWQKKGGWSKPQNVGNDQWKIPGCPVNGPSVVAKDSTVVVSWFTAAKGEGDVRVSFSKDIGKTFGSPFRIDVGSAIGRTDVVMLSSEKAAVLWMEPEGDETVIRLIGINQHGYTGETITVSKTSAERASGFPQLELIGDTAYIAWTEVSEAGKTIKTASVAVSDL
jgi:hypothetical protein